MRRTTGQFQATLYGEETVRAFVPFPLPPTNPPLVLEGVLATLHAEALAAVLARFTVVVQSPHWDEEEKRWLVDELATRGEPARIAS